MCLPAIVTGATTTTWGLRSMAPWTSMASMTSPLQRRVRTNQPTLQHAAIPNSSCKQLTRQPPNPCMQSTTYQLCLHPTRQPTPTNQPTNQPNQISTLPNFSGELQDAEAMGSQNMFKRGKRYKKLMRIMSTSQVGAGAEWAGERGVLRLAGNPVG